MSLFREINRIFEGTNSIDSLLSGDILKVSKINPDNTYDLLEIDNDFDDELEDGEDQSSFIYYNVVKTKEVDIENEGEIVVVLYINNNINEPVIIGTLEK